MNIHQDFYSDYTIFFKPRILLFFVSHFQHNHVLFVGTWRFRKYIHSFQSKAIELEKHSSFSHLISFPAFDPYTIGEVYILKWYHRPFYAYIVKVPLRRSCNIGFMSKCIARELKKCIECISKFLS